MNITNKDFEKLIIEAKRKKKKTTINLGGNLFAIVRPRSDKISFTIRVRTKSKDTMRTIGSFPNITHIPDQKISKIACFD